MQGWVKLAKLSVLLSEYVNVYISLIYLIHIQHMDL